MHHQHAATTRMNLKKQGHELIGVSVVVLFEIIDQLYDKEIKPLDISIITFQKNVKRITKNLKVDPIFMYGKI